jgi:hypothetical protein
MTEVVRLVRWQAAWEGRVENSDEVAPWERCQGSWVDRVAAMAEVD